LGVALVGAFAWVLASRRLGRVSVTAPILMTVLGLVYAEAPWVPSPPTLQSEPVRVLVEVTLAIILFTDASHISARWFGQSPAVIAGRLLGIGLPLTVLAGLGVALLLFPAQPVVALAVVAAALAPTDAALGASVMGDARIPERLRQVINVESGLNDGLATPVVLFFVALGVAEDDHASVGQAAASALVEIALAVVIGGVLGWVGGRLLLLADGRDWSLKEQEPIATFLVAVLAYLLAVGLGGNGFVAAFVAGVGFGTAMSGRRPPAVMDFTDRAGLLLSFLVWFVFGMELVPLAWSAMSWQLVAYAVLSLTLVRMVPVALSLIGAHQSRDDVLMLGWLGPRGLASIVFALIAVDELGGDQGRTVVGVVTVTVALSVVLHGLSAGPLATWYSRRHPGEPVSAGTVPGEPLDGS
jgi:NhaP-type Na+/H+ or K+/H+ antiporter